MGELDEALADAGRLRAAIRRHRDYRGDDRCHMDDEELYGALPEGYAPPVRDSAVELENCQRFIACRHNPATMYVSPQREIERLTQRLRDLESLAADMRHVLRRAVDGGAIWKFGGHLVDAEKMLERAGVLL